VPYPLTKISAYVLLGLGLYFANQYLQSEHNWNLWLSATACLLVYLLAVLFEARLLLRRRAA
jgi:uncharacterized membrane protein YbhN (UPF0104 family)